MELGIGLPISDPGRLPDWARRAEASGFGSLALLDRLAYDNPEPLIALSVLAGHTSRIRLQTEVLLGPLRATALLAKQVATLDRMSGGRFSLGIGAGGGRADDHEAAGVPLAGRGRLLDRQLATLREIWTVDPSPERHPATPDRGPGPVTPAALAAAAPRSTELSGVSAGPSPLTAGGPPILIGAFAPAALRRVAHYGDGFICAAPLAWAGGLVRTVEDEWAAVGRPGRPRLVCQVNVAVGSAGTVERARRAVAAYYAFTGRPGWGEPLTDPARIADTVAAYRDFGADELVLYCYGDDPDQIEELASVTR